MNKAQLLRNMRREHQALREALNDGTLTMADEFDMVLLQARTSQVEHHIKAEGAKMIVNLIETAKHSGTMTAIGLDGTPRTEVFSRLTFDPETIRDTAHALASWAIGLGGEEIL